MLTLIKAALLSCLSTCVKIIDLLCHICSDDKCQRGCNKGGVCTAVQYECICTKGFYKKGDQCVEGRFSYKKCLYVKKTTMLFRTTASACVELRLKESLFSTLRKWSLNKAFTVQWSDGNTGHTDDP